jgi:PST family polysaccharide transporter
MSEDPTFTTRRLKDIKGVSVRGGVATVAGQAATFVLQTGSSVVLARLLTPEDFGLQGMVVAITGFLMLFSDIGLSMATVHRDSISHEEVSTLFWLNVALGGLLALLTAGLAPVLVSFYRDPRLFGITIVLATTFLIGGLGAQHSALLTRSMRFLTRAKIDISALVISTSVGITLAALGYGYWALVAMTVSTPLITVGALWLTVRWTPGLPRYCSSISSMFHFGGTVTLNNVVVYAAYNAEKLLLGRYWGPDALGTYGRAYSLINLPTTQLHSAVFKVAFPTLSRLQADPERLRKAFLKTYSVVLSLTLPATLAGALFASEAVLVVLGPKWLPAAPVFRLLAPAVVVFGLVNPFGWFLISSGRAGRSLAIAIAIAPAVILGIVAGLRTGPTGVAAGYSTVMILLAFPILAWSIHGTGITWTDLWRSTRPPITSCLAAAIAGLLFRVALGETLTPLPFLVLGLGITLAVYGFMLLFVFSQRSLYEDLLGEVFPRVWPRVTQPERASTGQPHPSGDL